MKMTKKDILKKLEFYSREITKNKPTFDTVFRVYYDSLFCVSRIIYHVNENPWHPENDYRDEIFESIQEYFEELEKLNIKLNQKS